MATQMKNLTTSMLVYTKIKWKHYLQLIFDIVIKILRWFSRTFWSDFGWLNVNVITISANVISLIVLGVHSFFSSNTSRWWSVTYVSGNVSGSNFDTISVIFNTIFILHNVRPWIILQGRIQGGGGRTRRAPPLKLVKIWFFWRKIVIFHMKYPKNFARPP